MHLKRNSCIKKYAIVSGNHLFIIAKGNINKNMNKKLINNSKETQLRFHIEQTIQSKY